MRLLLTGLLAVGLLTVAVRADDKPTPTAVALAELKKDLEKAQPKFEGEEGQKLAFGYAQKFLTLAQQNPKDPASLEALQLALMNSGGPFSKNGIWKKAIEQLRTNHVTDSAIRPALQFLRGTFDEDSLNLLQEVATKNKDRKIQASAWRAIAAGMETAVNVADKLKEDKALRGQVEERIGKELVEKVLADADKNRRAGEEAKKVLKERFADFAPDLSVGKPVPEVVSTDVNGKEVKLSSFKGKVVVLDIWATWCPPCRAMIPHSREMVGRLKDKPFALISISADEDRKTLTEFLEKEKMPWAQWWNGPEGGILEDWDIQSFPTIYVIDAKGIIRFKGLRGEKLEEAVNELLKEAGK
jgi:thiol-disulfide isomerase/thioredoxin